MAEATPLANRRADLPDDLEAAILALNDLASGDLVDQVGLEDADGHAPHLSDAGRFRGRCFPR